jgi:hypothetical protein
MDWKEIKNFNNHKVSPCGKVLTISSGRVSLGCKTKYGYRVISSGCGGKTKQIFVHRAVYSSFMGEIPDGKIINHIDGNKENNSLRNLELVNHRQNSIHSVKNNLQPNLLEANTVLKVVELFMLGKKTGEISKILGITTRKITSIINGNTYSAHTGIKDRLGRARGSRVGNSKLGEDQVRQIKIKLSQGIRACDLCKEYGVQRTYIGKIARNETWKHVTI